MTLASPSTDLDSDFDQSLDLDEKFRALLQEIAKEPVSPHLLKLAQQLQDLLDAQAQLTTRRE